MSGSGIALALLALAAVYALGYVTGSLLVDRGDDRAPLSWAVIRLISGLLLSTIGFFLSLVLSLPWFVGPIGLFAAAVTLRRRAAFSLPRLQLNFTWDGLLAVALSAVLLSPIVISALRMAPGEYPPVFFNVDTAYFMEQVHSLTHASTYPPESLSNLDGRRSYHFGVHGMAALISRCSGLAPHHSLFAIVLPLLAGGILAAAVATAQRLGPALPSWFAVPLLVIMVPSLWYSFWDYVGPRLWLTATTLAFEPLDAVGSGYELWGVASIVGQNVGGHFVVLAALAGLAATASIGWRLPVFLIGTAIIVKTPTGIALLAGLCLAQAWQAAAARRFWPLMPALAAVAVFLLTYAAFWIVPPVESEFAIRLIPWFHVYSAIDRDGLLGLLADLVWVFLPVLMVVAARPNDPETRSLPLLLVGVAPFIVVNLTRAVDIRSGGSGATGDWLQILLPAPFVLHAVVLNFVGRRWDGLAVGLRAAVLVVMALTVLPAVFVAGRYSRILISDPESGHEFVDNRSIAAALAAIPTKGTVVVTNDLRYPAQRFNRDNRQMQIPSLFGHQAFAVNYAYEVFAFSAERRELQKLLQMESWSDELDQAARAHRWTHLLVHKDYVHPEPIPLERIFENESYAVYRFDSE